MNFQDLVKNQYVKAWGSIAAIAAGMVLLGNATKAFEALADIAPWVTEKSFAQQVDSIREPLDTIQDQVAVIRIDQISQRVETLKGELVQLEQMLDRDPTDTRLTVRRLEVIGTIAELTAFQRTLECRRDPFSLCPPSSANGDDQPGG